MCTGWESVKNAPIFHYTEQMNWALPLRFLLKEWNFALVFPLKCRSKQMFLTNIQLSNSYWVCYFLCFQLAAERSIKFFETSAFSNINVDEVCTCKSSYCQLIAHFQLALILSCFKVSVLGQLAFHVKSSSIHNTFWLIYMWRKLIFVWKALH